MLSHLNDLIQMNEAIFDNLSNAVNNAEVDHPEFDIFNNLFVEQRGLGNATVEVYRTVESELQRRGLNFSRLASY